MLSFLLSSFNQSGVARNLHIRVQAHIMKNRIGKLPDCLYKLIWVTTFTENECQI